MLWGVLCCSSVFIDVDDGVFFGVGDGDWFGVFGICGCYVVVVLVYVEFVCFLGGWYGGGCWYCVSCVGVYVWCCFGGYIRCGVCG